VFLISPRALIPSLVILIMPAMILAADGVALTVTGTTQLGRDFEGKEVPWWSGGALLALDGTRFTSQPYVRAFDRNGDAMFSAPFQLADGSVHSVYRLARGSDGIVALAGSAFFNDGARSLGHFIAWIAPDGKEQHVFRTSFVPDEMTVASDGAIWAQAWDGLREKDRNRGIIRRFDRSGKLLGAFVPKSSLTKYLKVGDDIVPSHLVASRDRIGWYSINNREYIEFSLDGSEIRRYPAADLKDLRFTGAGLCDDGGLFISAEERESKERPWQVFALDRPSKTWKSVVINEGLRSRNWGMIFGCEGSALVTKTAGSGSGELTWYTPTVSDASAAAVSVPAPR